MSDQNSQDANQGQPVSQTSSSTSAPLSNDSSTMGTPPVASATSDAATPEKIYAGKYKSVEDLEKGYKETTKYAREQANLAKDYQSQLPKAPDKYTFDFSGTDDLKDVTINPDSPDIAPILPVFQKHNITQEAANDIISTYLRSQAAMAPTAEQIKEQLGSNAEGMLSKLQNFTYKLPLEDQKIMQSLSDSAEGIDFLYRHLIGQELGVPAQTGTSSSAAKPAAELMAEAFKYKSDNANSIGFNKSQQDEYSKLMRNALIAEENEKKMKK